RARSWPRLRTFIFEYEHPRVRRFRNPRPFGQFLIPKENKRMRVGVDARGHGAEALGQAVPLELVRREIGVPAMPRQANGGAASSLMLSCKSVRPGVGPPTGGVGCWTLGGGSWLMGTLVSVRPEVGPPTDAVEYSCSWAARPCDEKHRRRRSIGQAQRPSRSLGHFQPDRVARQQLHEGVRGLGLGEQHVDLLERAEAGHGVAAELARVRSQEDSSRVADDGL